MNTLQWVRNALGPVLLAGMVLLGVGACADDGAGKFTEILGSWSGIYQNGGIPFGAGFQPLTHPLNGTLAITFTIVEINEVQGTVSANPDICDSGVAFTNKPIINGTMIDNVLTFTYTSTSITFPGDVVFTGLMLMDPMLGTYDATDCEPTWSGGFNVDKL